MARSATESDSRGEDVRTNDDRDGYGSPESREASGENGGVAGGGSSTSNPPATSGDELQDEWYGPLNAATTATEAKRGRPIFGGISKIETRNGRERTSYVGWVAPEEAKHLDELIEEFPEVEGRIQIDSTDPRSGEDNSYTIDVGARPEKNDSSSGDDGEVMRENVQNALYREIRQELQEEIREARQRARRQEKRADDLQEDLDGLNEKLRQARQEADEARRQKERELRQQRRDYREEIDELEGKLREVKKELSDLESENQRLERKVEQLESGEIPGGGAEKWLDHPLAERVVDVVENFTGAGGHPNPPLNGQAGSSSGRSPGRSAGMNGQAQADSPTSSPRGNRQARSAEPESTEHPRENPQPMDSSEHISDFVEKSIDMAKEVLSDQASTTAREFALYFDDAVGALGGQVGTTAYAEIAEQIARFAVKEGIPTRQVTDALEPVLRVMLSGSFFATNALRSRDPGQLAEALFALAGKDPEEAIESLVIEVLSQLKQRI